jgi:lipoprotein-anchoring transpeptidase ErfK/SrfK
MRRLRPWAEPGQVLLILVVEQAPAAITGRVTTLRASIQRWSHWVRTINVTERRRRVTLTAAGLTAMMALLAAAQGAASQGRPGTGGPGSTGPDGATSPAAQVIISPRHGSDAARPDRPIKVRAASGTIRDVSITPESAEVAGDFNADRTQWRSRRTLEPATKYQVTATAIGDDGKATTVRSSFATLEPKQTIAVSAQAPFDRETVGIGMPVILNFDRPVYNQAAVEKALEVRTPTPIEGAWRWVGRQQVIYRTKKYWPARTNVTVIAHMSGVRAAKNVYGTRDLRLRFKVGDAHISTAGAKTYKMTVKKNGKTIRKMPISMGKATKRAYTTTNGIHLTMEKAYHVVMDSATVGIPKGHPDYYKLDVYKTVRISNSGEFTHSAPWSVADQGRRNVSHGCVNLSPKNADWFYKFSQRGDIYKITGTDRELEWNNGWGYWQLSWNQWKKDSALT